MLTIPGLLSVNESAESFGVSGIQLQPQQGIADAEAHVGHPPELHVGVKVPQSPGVAVDGGLQVLRTGGEGKAAGKPPGRFDRRRRQDARDGGFVACEAHGDVAPNVQVHHVQADARSELEAVVLDERVGPGQSHRAPLQGRRHDVAGIEILGAEHDRTGQLRGAGLVEFQEVGGDAVAIAQPEHQLGQAIVLGRSEGQIVRAGDLGAGPGLPWWIHAQARLDHGVIETGGQGEMVADRTGGLRVVVEEIIGRVDRSQRGAADAGHDATEDD